MFFSKNMFPSTSRSPLFSRSSLLFSSRIWPRTFTQNSNTLSAPRQHTEVSRQTAGRHALISAVQWAAGREVILSNSSDVGSWVMSDDHGRGRRWRREPAVAALRERRGQCETARRAVGESLGCTRQVELLLGALLLVRHLFEHDLQDGAEQRRELAREKLRKTDIRAWIKKRKTRSGGKWWANFSEILEKKIQTSSQKYNQMDRQTNMKEKANFYAPWIHPYFYKKLDMFLWMRAICTQMHTRTQISTCILRCSGTPAQSSITSIHHTFTQFMASQAHTITQFIASQAYITRSLNLLFVASRAI